MKLYFDLDYLYKRLENPVLDLEEKISLNHLKKFNEGETWKNEDIAENRLDADVLAGEEVLLPLPFYSMSSKFTRIKDFYSVVANFNFDPSYMSCGEDSAPTKNSFFSLFSFFKKTKKQKESIKNDSIYEKISAFHSSMAEKYKNDWNVFNPNKFYHLTKGDVSELFLGFINPNYVISMGIGGVSKKLFNEHDFKIDMNNYVGVVNHFFYDLLDKNLIPKDKALQIDMFGQ